MTDAKDSEFPQGFAWLEKTPKGHIGQAAFDGQRFAVVCDDSEEPLSPQLLPGLRSHSTDPGDCLRCMELRSQLIQKARKL